MNKRITKKLCKKFCHNEVFANMSCIYCVNWGLGCANGHPAVYPGDNSDYLEGCKEMFEATSFFAKHLTEEDLSLSGWKLSETLPSRHEYIYYNKKKHKEIAIAYDTENSNFVIETYDIFWICSNGHNVYRHNTINEALAAPWQQWNHVIGCRRYKVQISQIAN